MDKYTIETATLEVIKWSKIPRELKKCGPKDCNPHFARLLRFQGTNIFQWQFRPVRTCDDWANHGKPIQCHRAKKQNRCFICEGNHLPDECPARGN